MPVRIGQLLWLLQLTMVTTVSRLSAKFLHPYVITGDILSWQQVLLWFLSFTNCKATWNRKQETTFTSYTLTVVLSCLMQYLFLSINSTCTYISFAVSSFGSSLLENLCCLLICSMPASLITFLFHLWSFVIWSCLAWPCLILSQPRAGYIGSFHWTNALCWRSHDPYW